MRPKKLSKKLGLNKKTIANLNNGEMRNAYGREQKIPRTTYAFPDCATCPTCETCQTCIPTDCETVCGSIPCCY